MKDHDDTPQRDRPLKWSSADRRIGSSRKPGPQVWPSSSRATSERRVGGFKTADRQIGRPVEPPVVERRLEDGQDPTRSASRVERQRPRGRRQRRASR
jgi:hypothetical protein